MATKQTVATTDNNTAVGNVIDYGDHSGGGFERQTSADMAIPFINLLQTNSPQVSKANKEAYIEGAEAGSFLNTVSGEIIDGEAGFLFVPVSTEHCFVLWRPRESGGGFAGKLEMTDPQVNRVLSSGVQNEKGIPLTADGLEMKETFYIYGLTINEVGADSFGSIVVIPFVSTKIKAYRHYMSKLRQHKQLAKAPLYAHQARITTVGQQNAHGSFFNVSINPAVDGPDAVLASALPAGHPMLALGREMLDSILSGTRTAAYDSVGNENVESSEDAVF